METPLGVRGNGDGSGSLFPDRRRVRRGRQHVAKSDAGTSADSDAYPDPHPDTDTDTDTDADPDTDAERWDDDHHHVRGRVTQDADGAAGNTRNVRKQRHAGA